MAHVQVEIFVFSFLYHVWIILVTKHHQNHQNLFSVLYLIDSTKYFLHFVIYLWYIQFGDIIDSFCFKDNMVGYFVRYQREEVLQCPHIIFIANMIHITIDDIPVTYIYIFSLLMSDIILWPLNINHPWYPVIPGNLTTHVTSHKVFQTT